MKAYVKPGNLYEPILPPTRPIKVDSPVYIRSFYKRSPDWMRVHINILCDDKPDYYQRWDKKENVRLAICPNGYQ